MRHFLEMRAAWRLTLVIGFALSGCGGGDEPATATASDRGTNSNDATGVFTGYADVDTVGANADGDGRGGFGVGGSLGRIRGASVVATFPDGSELGRAPLGDDGRVTIRPGAGYTGPLLIEIRGEPRASHYDEARQADIGFAVEDTLRLALPSPPTGWVAVTPLTNAAVRYLERLSAPARFLSDSAAVEAANERMRAQVNRFLPANLQLADIVAPAVLVSAATPSNSLGDTTAEIHARALAALAQAALVYDPRLAKPAAAFSGTLASDMTDGIIDNRDSDGQPAGGSSGVGYDVSRLAGDLAKGAVQSDGRLAQATADRPGNATPSLAVCPASYTLGGITDPMPLVDIVPAGSLSTICRYRAPGNAFLVNGVTIGSSPYTSTELGRCSAADDNVAVQVASVGNGQVFVAYSTVRQVRISTGAANTYDVALEALRRAVLEGVGEPCP
ncbi:MAG: hypothetical protein R3E87_02355 [Burkholderiaceae bacterium]